MTTATLTPPATEALSATDGGPESATRRKVAIICSKGSLDMAYPGLILANAARMMGIDAMIFFTFWGLDIVREKTVDRLQPGIVGNPAAHMPHMLAGLPGMGAVAGRMMRKQIDGIQVPDVRELIETLEASGAELYGCHLAMEMMGLSKEDLVPQVADVITAMDFFEKSEGAQIVFI
ncbi:MAG: DsrE/DsrF/DrsH-like family protein [Gemmatimonadota bacterium]|jgi:peroxiredoxin family protein